MPKDPLGQLGESLAVEYLLGQKYQILERNFKNHIGELDIVASKDGLVCFVEVKTRISEEYGQGLEAVDYRKQRKLILLAQSYLMTKQLEDVQVRFDVLGIDYKNSQEYTIEFIENAFEAGR